MPAKHPHAEATYRILPHLDLRFAVEVTVPETRPTMVTSFATELDAEKWIAWHRGRVADTSRQPSGRWVRSRPKADPARAEPAPKAD